MQRIESRYQESQYQGQPYCRLGNWFRREMAMAEYTYNSDYLMKDGKAWFPVMGEMHFSRYREDLWEESLRKIKAGGVDIVSTYVIWIHHEEEEGVFDFSGCRNVRRFLELCGKVGLQVCLRIGPWVHGEVRNGGFPDWVVKKGESGVELRSNDSAYLKMVRRYWREVAGQAEGLMAKDGGPVIALQLENEYGHVGGFRGEKGEAHMRTLMALAKELGFEVPVYTATGWGGAVIGDCIPVMGGYCEAPWDRSVKELPANANYVISHIRNDALIACDHHKTDDTTFDESRFPYLTAELGGGLQVTSHRRPVAGGKDIGAMSLTKLASGVALLGYYMYHGGSNPRGKLSTLQESRATGYPNDLPEINYDFNAPIRQYGTISDNYKEIRLLAYFLRDFGEDLAPLKTEIFPENVMPEDLHTLRTSCRHDDVHGYLFFNNYQRRRIMDSHEGVVLKGKTKTGEITFPSLTIGSGEYGFFPYNMRLGSAVLESALATPLCRLNGAEGTYVFYGDYEPCYHWKEGRADVLHLTREQALNAWKVTLDQDYLVIHENYVWEEKGVLAVTGGADTRILMYPEPDEAPLGFVKAGKEGRFTIYERKLSERPAEVECRKLSEDEKKAVYELRIRYYGEKDRMNGRDTLLRLAYAGDSMEIYLGEEKINDHFYTGQKVLLSLGYFGFPEVLRVSVNALRRETPVFLEQWPEMEGDRACSLVRAEILEEYR